MPPARTGSGVILLFTYFMSFMQRAASFRFFNVSHETFMKILRWRTLMVVKESTGSVKL